MKLRVVGWTDARNKKHSNLEEGEHTAQAHHVIVEDLIEHGYNFTGDDHLYRENCTPVLSDGKEYSYGQRAWGHIMAEAHGHYAQGAYVQYAWNAGPDENTGIYPPKERTFDIGSFVLEEDLSETFEIEVTKDVFQSAVHNRKITIDQTAELRFLDKGDTLKLRFGEQFAEYLVANVTRGRDLTPQQQQAFEAICKSGGGSQKVAEVEEMYNKAKKILHVSFDGAEKE